MKWANDKLNVITLLEKLGYSRRGKTDMWDHPLKNNPMKCVIDLSKIPGPKNKMDIFLLDEERPTEREYTDHDSIVHDTQESISALLDSLKIPNANVEQKQDITPIQPKDTKKPETNSKKNVPAKVEKPHTPAKNKYTVDPDIDRKMEEKKTKDFLQQRGTSYSVSGKNRPDAHAIQHAANAAGVNTDILKTEQNDKFCEVIVRAHLGNSYADGVVHHDFDVEKQLKTMEMINNNPHVLERWGDNGPVIKPDATIKSKTKDGFIQINAMYYVVHAILQQKKFAIRDARTKAASIAQAMVLNREDWRDPEEVESEYEERDMVQSSIEARKGQRRS